jgi:hypothetical protein
MRDYQPNKKILEEIMDNPRTPSSWNEFITFLRTDSLKTFEEYQKYIKSTGHDLDADSMFCFLEEKGLHLNLAPEFYKDGINFNWQWLWYEPKEHWSEYNICAGTFFYGDNNEYPTRNLAWIGAIELGFRLIENGLLTGEPEKK